MNAIICTGFHRSGTSLTGKTLHNCGLSYALNKMGNDISNPDGHFEDIEVMKIHDEFLAQSGTNWQFADEVPLIFSNNLLQNRLKDYIETRFQCSNLWFVKDPRASLFLDFWKESLNKKGFFLLLFRHWSLCIQSLINRTSRELAFNPSLNFSTKKKFFG